ncbi:WD40 repeat-like protein [Mycena sanguinolenta]|uniref:WD40 repeat-like protein n=1 Tax=Mycena sanguinolenta TaxID=230812 RepID=A0A8H6XF14_9AGAR|nr:WD40 repeat-like protein [Mycena sanguinolenta]
MVAIGLRQPHQIPLPPSPASHTKSQKAVMSRKGKGKAKEPTVAAPKRRVHVPSSEPSSDPSWDWTCLTDSLASNVPPIFTKDGSYFFSLVGSSVRIYAVTTGKIVSTLSIPRPTGSDASLDTLTCAVLNPHNAFQLITGSLAGVLAVWDFLEATLLQIIDIAQPIHHICVHENFKESVFVTASRPSKKGVAGVQYFSVDLGPPLYLSDDNAIVLRVSLKPAEAASQSTAQKSSEITPIGKIRVPNGLSFSPGGGMARFTKYVSPERLTCLAFHPTEDYFATGDEKGNIRLWYYLGDQQPVKPVGVEKKTQTTSLHWHAHAVSSITFTSNGACIPGSASLYPRVGSPIKTITVSKMANGEEEYLLGLADATYAFVGAASLKILRSYSRIKLDPATVFNAPSTSKHSPTPLSVHSLTSTLILPSSHPASLQVYSPSSSTVVSELEVSPSNRVSRREDKSIEPCRVERATVSASGDWMATIDIREGDESTHGECYLKIWRWDRKAGYWILNTRVDRPHGLEKVVHVAFSLTSDSHSVLLSTVGEDRNVKTFRIQTAKSKSGISEEFWVARSTLSLQNEAPSQVSWSPDASLMAVTMPKRVAIFDPSSNLLRHSVAFPELGSIAGAYFIGKAGRYLAVVGAVDLVLWDLVDQRVRWYHKSSGFIRTLVSHPRNDTFAVVLASSSQEERPKCRVALFEAGSAQPIKSLSLPFGFRNVAWYPLGSSSFSIVGITYDWKVVVLGENIHVAKEEGSVSREIASQSAPQRRTLFQDIFGKSAFGEQANAVQSSGPTTARPWTGRENTGVFEDPAYLMPPLEKLFEPLMNGFLKSRVVEAPVLPPAPIDNENVDMEAGEGTIVAGADAKRVVGAGEMDAMTDLFRTCTLKAKAPVTARAATPRRNGLVNGKPNGVSPHPHPKHGATAPSKAVVEDSPAGSPMVNGKKRKKSLG